MNRSSLKGYDRKEIKRRHAHYAFVRRASMPDERDTPRPFAAPFNEERETDTEHAVSAADPFALTTKQRAALERIRLTPEDYAFLCGLVGNRFDFIYRPAGADTWVLCSKWPLSPQHLVNHLLGKCWIGTGCRRDAASKWHRTDWIIVDLDHGGDDADLGARYDGVRAALGAPTFVVRSSASAGLHLYYQLTEATDLHLLRTPDGPHGAVQRLLAAHGVPESAGQVEVYPRGKYKQRGTQNRVRLPFGMDSLLLDPHDWTAIAASGPAGLRHLRMLADAGKLEPIDPADWTHRAADLPLVAPTPTAKRSATAGEPRRSDRSASETSGLDVARLWREGLYEPRQFNAAVLALAADLRRHGASMDEARQRIERWIDTGNNGAMSRTYSTSPAAAYREIADVVARLYAKPFRATFAARPEVSPFEVQTLLDRLAGDCAIADPDTGELLKRFKVEEFAFELIRFAKQWIVTRMRQVVERVASTHPGLDRSSPEFSDLVAQASSAFWPDRTLPEFVVPIPYALRTKAGFKSERASLPLWRAIKHAGAFPLQRVACPRDHRAATYLVTLDFGAFSEPAISFGTFAQAAAYFFSPSEIGERYSRHYARNVRVASEVVCAIDAKPAPGTVVGILRGLLTASATHSDAHNGAPIWDMAQIPTFADGATKRISAPLSEGVDIPRPAIIGGQR